MKKRLFIAVAVLTLLASSACKEERHYDGQFTTEHGMTFLLRQDSTTVITYDDETTYEGTWKAHTEETDMKYATIELGGVENYYYLHKGYIYRSKRNMERKFLGDKVTYQE